jgi:hypothetical protein
MAGGAGQGPDAERRGRGALRSDAGHSGGGDRHEDAEERHEPYGPLCIERHIKEDGRALILYARRKPEDG